MGPPYAFSRRKQQTYICCVCIYSRFIKRNNCSVGMSNKLCVQVKRSSIAVANSSNRSSSNSRNGSNSWDSSNSWGSSNDRGRSSIFSSLGIKMCCSGSSNSWFIKRNNSSVGVSNELSVQVKGASIAVGSSISWGISSISGSNNWGSCSIAIASTISSISGSNRSSIAKTSIPIPSTIPSISITSSISWSIASISQTCSKLGSKMVSTGSSNCWLINRSHSSVRVGLQTIETLGRGYGHTGSENQKLHICSRM